jgi:hypothetical protein
MSTMKLLMACTVTALLGACGGGSGNGSGNSGSVPTEQAAEFVPLAASDGTAVFAGWLNDMSKQTLDNRDSMNTSTFTPIVQEDADPVAAPV